MLSITLPDDMEARLRAVAEETGQSLEECAREGLRRFLEELGSDRHTQEDAEDARLIRERLAVWERQGRPGVTLEEYARVQDIGGPLDDMARHHRTQRAKRA